MKKNPLAMIVLISVVTAIVVAVVLKLIGQGNPTVIGGGVAGGVAGALSANFLNTKKEQEE